MTVERVRIVRSPVASPQESSGPLLRGVRRNLAAKVKDRVSER